MRLGVGTAGSKGKMSMRRFIILWVPLIALFALFGTTLAQSGGSYTLTWFTTDGGGNSSGASYTLGGTAGQPEAGQMSGGPYSISGGYWGASQQGAPPNTPTRTATRTITRTPTRTKTPALTPTRTPTRTKTPALTATRTPTRTQTPALTATRTPTRTKTPSGNTATFTPTRTMTPGSGCQTKPDKPKLKSPGNNTPVNTTRPTLKWKKADCAKTYKVVVKDSATGNVAYRKGGLTGLEQRVPAEKLTQGATYKWSVKGCNPGFGCAKSKTWSFTVQ